MNRDEFAAKIMAGICAGDWKFNIPEGKTWDEVAAKRSYEIADAMIKTAEKSLDEMKNRRKMTKQMQQNVKEIVDYYMQFVTGEHHSIRESFVYFWKCMSNTTIEDYVEDIRGRKAQDK
jgi:hypothetical protein